MIDPTQNVQQRLQQRLFALLVLCAALTPAFFGFLFLLFVVDGVTRWIILVACMLAGIVVGWFAVRALRTYKDLKAQG